MNGCIPTHVINVVENFRRRPMMKTVKVSFVTDIFEDETPEDIGAELVIAFPDSELIEVVELNG